MHRFLLFISSLFSLFLCSPLAYAETQLRIGVLPAADSIILHLAVDKVFFEKQGLNVTLVPFQSALELGSAMRAGALDGHFGDIMNVLLQNETGIPQAIIATTSHSAAGNRHFGLVVSPRSKVQTIHELQGQPIAISSATIIDFLFSALLKQEKLPQDFLQPQDIRQIAVRLQMLLSGQIESALLPEPLVSLVESKGARTLLDDRALSIPLAVIALTRSRLNAPETPKLAASFRNALLETAEWINAHPAETTAEMATKKLLPQNIASSYAPLHFDMQYTPLGLPTEADIQNVASWMQTRKMLRAMPVYTDVVLN